MSDPVAHLQLKKWHSLAFACDTKNDVISVYLDGTALVKDYDYTVSNTAADYSNLYRIAFSSWNEGEATADVAVIFAAVSAIAASGAVVLKKKR